MESIKSYYYSAQNKLVSLKNGMFPSPQPNKNQIVPVNHLDALKRSFEDSLVRLIEVSLWTSPITSGVWLVSCHTLLYCCYYWSSSLLSLFCYLTLSLYLYLTVTQTLWPVIRVQPSADTDTETWTQLDPDIPSPQEIRAGLVSCGTRVGQIAGGLVLLRQEQPRLFCVILSSIFLGIASLGVKLNTQLLLHLAAFLIFVMPGCIVKMKKNENVSWCFDLIFLFISSVSDSLVYKGVNYQQQIQEHHDSKDLSLSGNLVIPSHDEVENESLNNLLEFERGLQLTHEQSLGTLSESECESDASKEVGDIADYNDSEGDSLSLDPEVTQSPAAAAFGAAVSKTVSDSLSSNLGSVLGSMITNSLTSAVSQQQQHKKTDDFEIISEDELYDEDDF